MNKKVGFFRVSSIVMIVSGSFAVLVYALIFVLGALLLIFDKNSLSEVINEYGRFAGPGLAIAAAGGILQFITGIYSIKNYKKPEKTNTFIHLGAITAILSIASLVLDYFLVNSYNPFENISVYVGMVIPAAYIVSAVQLKSESITHIYRTTGLSKIFEFIVKRKERIFEILFTLIICGFIGWLFETTVVLIDTGTLTARGMLFISRINGFPIVWGLPLILMYGIGGAILIWCFKPLAKEPIKLFFVGIFVTTIFEYATSLFCEDVLGMVLWDYSDAFMNFQGRVCLKSSLAWGALSVISVKFLTPLFEKMYNGIKNKNRLHIIIIVLMIFIIVCYLLRPILNVEQY